jgi:hypothetical protein
MAEEIQRTTVTPTEDGSVVQLHISDALPGDESASFVLQLSVSLPKYGEALLFAHVQREALRVAGRVVSHHLEMLAREIGTTDRHLEPLLKGQRP